MPLAEKPQLSVVVPCFNEQESLPLLRERLIQALDGFGVSWELILVDDGSRDSTLEILSDMHRQDPRCKVLSLSRNFGHQTAISAGLSYAAGDAVAILDADLQDPPEVLGACLEQWRNGYEVVYAVRRNRKEGLGKRAAYRAFYRLLHALADIDIPVDSGDFCLMDRHVAEVVRNMPERNIFLRGMRAWAGFRQIGIEYDRPARVAGDTKYPLWKLVRLALDGIFAFSTAPLRLATWCGLFLVVLCFLGVVFVVVWRVAGFEFMGHTGRQIPGWTGGIVSVLFLGGVQLLMLGLLGEYLARIYNEVKWRPRWVVRSTLGLERRPGGAE